MTYSGAMPRWEGNARERLIQSTLDLFTDKGYDAATVVDIVERAGLTKATFFRHFSDKREVLFSGQESHTRLMREAILSAPASATPIQAVTAGLDALTSTFTPAQRAYGPQISAVTAASNELRERAALKRSDLTAAVAEALRDRDVPELVALVTAELTVLTVYTAFDTWCDPSSTSSYSEIARATLLELHAAAAALT